jgi:hypothetical protein
MRARYAPESSAPATGVGIEVSQDFAARFTCEEVFLTPAAASAAWLADGERQCLVAAGEEAFDSYRRVFRVEADRCGARQ